MSYKNLCEALQDIFRSKIKYLKFFGHTAYHTMSNGNIAEICFDNNGHSDNYSQLRVQIKNKNSGIVTANFFIFEEYLERALTDNEHAGSVSRMHIWDNINGIDWYIVRPKETKPITDAIFEYIQMYDD